LGSFENEQNIPHFVRFAEEVFKTLTVDYLGRPLVQQFFTINEPSIEAFSRYVLGSFPSGPQVARVSTPSLVGTLLDLFNRHVLKRLVPGTIGDFNRAGHFLRGALRAHTAVYHRLKEVNPDSSIKIGFTHQYLSFSGSAFKYFTHLINEVTLRYIRTGIFELKMPLCHIYSEDENPPMDFLGVQYYVRPVIGLTGPTSYYEPMTLMPFREDPEGLYQAIIDCYNHAQRPIIVTENGISTRNEDQRIRYITRALFAAKQAAERIGPENLKGYYYWCFVRNLEWNMGMVEQDFGAYELNADGTVAEKSRAGMASFIKVTEALNRLRPTTPRSEEVA
jgi:beta-glucosidase